MLRENEREFVKKVQSGIRKAGVDYLLDVAPKHNRFTSYDTKGCPDKRMNLVDYHLFCQAYEKMIDVAKFGVTRLQYLVPTAYAFGIPHKQMMEFVRDLELTDDMKKIIGLSLVKHCNSMVYPVTKDNTGFSRMHLVGGDGRWLVRDGYIKPSDLLLWWPETHQQPTNDLLNWLMDRSMEMDMKFVMNMFSRNDWLLPGWFYHEMVRHCLVNELPIGDEAEDVYDVIRKWANHHGYATTSSFMDLLYAWLGVSMDAARIERGPDIQTMCDLGKILKAIDTTGYIDAVEAYITTNDTTDDDSRSRRLKVQYRNMMRLALYNNKSFVKKYGEPTVAMLTMENHNIPSLIDCNFE